MSEPYAAVLRAQMTRPALIAYLEGRGNPASGWPDWASIGGSWALSGAGESDVGVQIGKMAAELDGVLTGAPRRAQWAAFLEGAEHPKYGHCSYGQPEGTLTLATLTFTENLSDVLWFLALARGIGDYLEPGGSGLAVVRGFIWDRETAAVALLEPASSRLVPADDEVTRTAAEVAADAVFRGIWDLASRADSEAVTPAAAPLSAMAVLKSLR